MKEQIELIAENWKVKRILNDSITVQEFIQALVDENIVESKDKVTKIDDFYKITTKDGNIFEAKIDNEGNITIKAEEQGETNKEAVARIEENYYTSMQKAVNAVPTNVKTTIHLLKWRKYNSNIYYNLKKFWNINNKWYSKY